MTRLVAVVDPYELLVPMGYKVDEHTIKTKEKDIVTICPECTSATHWKESQYEIERARNINA